MMDKEIRFGILSLSLNKLWFVSFVEEVSTFVTLTIDLIDILIEKKNFKIFIFIASHIPFRLHPSQKI